MGAHSLNPQEEKNVKDHIESIQTKDHTKLCQQQLFSMVPPDRHVKDDCWCHK